MRHVYVDDLNNDDANKFVTLLSTFNLKQHVNFSTHKMGHTLDLFITHKETNINPTVEYEYLCFSDHLALIAEVTVPVKNRPQSIYKEFRRYASIDIDSFKHDLKCSAIFNDNNITSDSNSYTEYLLGLLTIFLINMLH